MNDTQTVIKNDWFIVVIYWLLGGILSAILITQNPHLQNGSEKSGDPIVAILLFAGITGGYFLFFRYSYYSEQRYKVMLNHFFTGMNLGALLAGYCMYVDPTANFAYVAFSVIGGTKYFYWYTSKKIIFSPTE